MRNPRRWRNIGLGFAASGFAAMGVHFMLPAETVHNTLTGAILTLFWPNALLFGGGSAIFNHSKLRAQDALLRGEDIIARWRVDAATWRAFIELNDRLHLATDDPERVVAHFGRNPPGVPDFLHGAGDGTDPEDLSKCIGCGFETHQFVSHCPRCGKGMQSRRWSRRFGRALVVCGLFITAAMALVLHYTAPLLLRPGISIDGTRFSGTAGQGLLFLGILAIVTAFGVMTLLYGLFQIRTGQRDKKVIYSLAGFAALLWLISRWL